MHEELIIRYITQQSSEKENRDLLAWVRQSDANQQEFIEFCAAWQAAKTARFDANKAFSKFTTSTHSAPKGKRIAFWKPLLSIAAVAMLFLGLFFLHTPQQQQEFVTIANLETEPQQIILPDNSEIVLQQGAQITYPTEFAADSRAIKAQGVVFCKIARNEKAPFTVDCENFSIEVLGTEFEIGTESAHVIVNSGKVRVHHTTTKESVEITKNERVDVKTYSLKKAQNNDANHLSWNTGLLKFSNTPLSQVFSDLNRHYKCNINIANSVIESYKITGTYQNMKLNEILEIIHSAFPHIHFSHSQNNLGNALEITVHL